MLGVEQLSAAEEAGADPPVEDWNSLILAGLIALDASPEEEFFPALAGELSRLPGIDIVVVSEALAKGVKANTLAAYAVGSPIQDFTFLVAEGDPSRQQEIRYWTQGSPRASDWVPPIARWLQAQALQTQPLVSSASKVVGWISVGSRDSAELPAEIELALRAFRGRATREILRKRQMEDSIRSQERYRRFFRGEFFAAFITRSDGEIVDCNQACASLLGYDSVQQLREANTLQVFWHTPDRQAALDRLRRDGTISRYRSRLKRRDGSPVDVVIYAQGRFDEDGESVGTVGILFPDSDQQRFQDRLLEQSALLEKTGEAVVVCQPNRTVKSWNAKAQEMFQFPLDIPQGLDWSHLIGPADNLDLEEAWEQVMASGLWTGELRLTSPEGSGRYVRSRWHLLEDSEGQPRSVLMVGTDITGVRAVETTNYRMQRLESLGTLAGGIAHDLNNVLTPMLLSANLLRDSIQDPRDQKLLESMITTARRGKEMVRQILWFARGTGGERNPMRLNTVLLEIQRILEHTLPRSIDLEVDIAKNLLPIRGDATQIFQALMNLCINARDAMPSGGHLKVTARVVSEEEARSGFEESPAAGPMIVLEVADTGCGIPREELEKVFDPFFTTRAAGEGTGLGLTTANSIVKSHGGTMALVSEPGQGTVFRLLLPGLEENGLEEGGLEESGLEQGLKIAPQLRPMGRQQTILVADDDPDVLQVTATTLETHGYRVLQARDGSEVVEIFAEHTEQICAVLCDQDMPILEGLEALQVIGRIAPEVKRLLLTGLPGFKPALDSVAVLVKPWSPQELLDALVELLGDSPELFQRGTSSALPLEAPP